MDKLRRKISWSDREDKIVCEVVKGDLSYTGKPSWNTYLYIHDKDMVDYDWIFDALFFGRGYVSMMEFDRKTMTPVPEVWDPMTVIRDPDATSVRGDKKGRGKCRFLFREIRRTKNALKDAGVYFNLDKIKVDDGKDINSLVDRNAQLRNDAQGRANLTSWNDLVGDNRTYRL